MAAAELGGAAGGGVRSCPFELSERGEIAWLDLCVDDELVVVAVEHEVGLVKAKSSVEMVATSDVQLIWPGAMEIGIAVWSRCLVLFLLVSSANRRVLSDFKYGSE